MTRFKFSLVGATLVSVFAFPAFGQDAQIESIVEIEKAAYQSAATGDDKYEAALRVAAAQSLDNRFGSAQVWLRIAANHATTIEKADRVRDAYQRVQSQNPLSASLSFSVARSDNVNDGVEDEEFFLGPFRLFFAPEQRALSGYEVRGAASLSYRIHQSEQSRTALTFDLSGTSYKLSDEALSIAPDALGRDFSQAKASVGIKHDALIFPQAGLTQVALQYGRDWSGGLLQRDFVRLDVTQQIFQTEEWSFSLGGSYQRDTAIDLGQPDAHEYGLRADVAKRFANDDLLSIGLLAELYDAEIDTYHHRRQRIDIRYGLAQRIAGMELTFNAGYEYKSYDEFFLSLDGRRDQKYDLGVTAVFKNFTAFGFSPSLTVSAYRNESNVDRFDTQGISANMGIASNF